MAAVAVTLRIFSDSELRELIEKDERLRHAMRFERALRLTCIRRQLSGLAPEAERQTALPLKHLTESKWSRGNVTTEPKSEAWAALTSSLGLAGAPMGKQLRTPAGVPPLAGLVERVGEDPFPEELLLRLDEPMLGIAHLFAMDMGGQVYVSIRFYLYGDKASAAVARDEPLWQAWMNKAFPSDGKGIESSPC